MGYAAADYVGKPVIAIVDTWSDANQCHSHFKQRVDDVKRGVLQAGGFPLELPAISLSESLVKPQRKAVEDCPPGAVLVIDSRKDARAASAGGILVTRLMKRGVAGVVTDGGFRDSPDIAKLSMPAYHARPSAPTNLTLHQAIDINVPIGCGDAPVFPGDVIVGDAEGAVVLPAHLADELADEATEMTAFEDFVQERVMAGQSILGLYPPTDEANKAAFEAWRKSNAR
jgi:regulator of RNase E activity RraA